MNVETIDRFNVPALLPFMVEHRNTENWNAHSAQRTHAEALEIAGDILKRHPMLPVRILRFHRDAPLQETRE